LELLGSEPTPYVAKIKARITTGLLQIQDAHFSISLFVWLSLCNGQNLWNNPKIVSQNTVGILKIKKYAKAPISA